MELCPNCEKEVISKKVITCKFCDKYFCSLTCLMKHSSFHSQTTTSNTLINNLKKKEAKDNFSVVVSHKDIKEKGYSLSS